MSVVASLAAENSDVQLAGAPAAAQYGLGATYLYPGTKELLTPEVVANKFWTLFNYCDNYRKRFLPEMLAAYAQYNGDVERRDKEPWQANVNVPLPSQAIDVATGRICQAIFESEDFFEVDPDRRADDLLTEFAKKATKWQIRKSHGMPEIKGAIKDALICGLGVLKIHFRAEQMRFTDTVWKPARLALAGQIIPEAGEWQFKDSSKIVRRMCFENPMPTDIWLDPSGKNRFLIQKITRYPSDLWPLTKPLYAEDGTLLRKAVYDAKYVQRVKPGMRDDQRAIEGARIRRDVDSPYGNRGYDQSVDLYEFWGDFPDPDTGTILFQNVVATFAYLNICLRYPERNPFLHITPPFIITQSKLLPHQVYGYGLLHQNRKLQDALNEQANVMLDKAMLQVPTLEYDPSASKDPTMNTSRPKFAPGKMWPRKPGPDKKIFYPTEGFQPIQPMDMAMLDRIVNWYQISSTVPEFATGNQLSNNRKTAEEAQIRAQAAQQNFNDAAVHLQDQAIGPMLKMIYLTMLQYEDQYDDVDLERAFGDDQEALGFIQQMKSMTPAERWRVGYLDAEFKAVGITNEITRQKRLQETGDFMRITSADTLLGMFIDKREQLRVMLNLYHQPQRMVLNQADAMIQAIQMARVSQMMGPQPMGPPMGPAGAPGGMPFGGQKGPNGAPGGSQTNPHNSLASVAGEAGRVS